MNDAHDIDRLKRTVSIHRRPAIPSYVRMADIPQPWRDRFLKALVGSQAPVVEGESGVAYEADWVLFLERTERRLRAGHIAEILKDVKAGPLPEVLEAAPVLDPWLAVWAHHLPVALKAAPVPDLGFFVWPPSRELSLLGAVSGHPRLPGEGRWIVTSMLIGLDLVAGHARTVSRWYRLGRLVDVAECEALRDKPLNPAFTPIHIDEMAPWFASLRAHTANEGFDV